MSKRFSIVVMVLVLSVAGCKRSERAPERGAVASSATASAAPAVSSAAPSEPEVLSSSTGKSGQFGWKTYDQESFATQPSQGRVFVVPLHATKLRVTLSASQPVLAGVMTREQLSTGRGVVRAAKFLALPCGIVGRSAGERECALSVMTPEVFVLRDVREQTMVGSRIGANNINVTLAVWACVSDCKVAEGGQ